MKNIYILRHGETDYNLEHRLQGRTSDISLNDTGKTEARAVANKIKKLNIDVIFTSPLKRALETAEIIASETKILLTKPPLIISDSFIEISFGEAEGKLHADLHKKDPAIYNEWLTGDDLDFSFPEGEKKRDAQTRIIRALKTALKKYNNICVVTHGALLSSFLLKLGIKKDFNLPKCQLIHIIYEDDKFILANDCI